MIKIVEHRSMANVVCPLLLVLLLIVALPCKADQTDYIELGNCDTDIPPSHLESVSTSGGGAALYYPASSMQMYKDCEITEIHVGISEPKTVTSMKVFISRSLDEPFDYEQACTPSKDGWNTVELSEPYVLDGGEVYIGYEVEGCSYLYYSSKAEDGEEWYCKSAGAWQKYTKSYSAALYATVSGDNLPKYNICLKNAVMPGYAVVGEPYTSELTLSNLGVAAVNSLELTYTVGDEQYTSTVEGLDVAYKEDVLLEADGLVIDKEGEQDVTITITKVNGSADYDMTDNTSQTVNVISRAEFVQRKVLLEMFSTENCYECPKGHEIINGLIEDNDNVVEVCHHAGYLTDSFTIDASSEYEWFYNSSTYAPALMLDRTNMYDKYPAYYGYPVNYFYTVTPVFWQSSASFISLLLDKQLSEPAYATVNVEAEQDGGNVTVNVSGEKLLPIGDKECRLFVILTEDSLVTRNQAGTTSAFYYEGSPRMMLSDTWGDAVDLDEGYNKTYNFTVSDEWNTDQLKIVAFVSTYNADDRNDCQVLNTEMLKLAAPVEEPSGEDSTCVDALELGNCDTILSNFETIDQTGGGAALYYPESTMQMYKGCEITEIHVGVCEYKTVTSMKVFISHSLDEPFDYEQAYTPANEGWNTVELDEPYVLDGSEIYIGFAVEGCIYVYYSPRLEDGEEWYCKSAGAWKEYTKSYSAALYATMSGDNLPKHNVRLKNAVMPGYAVVGEPYTAELTFSNLGAAAVNSLELTYTVGDEQYTSTVDGLDVAYKDEALLETAGLTIDKEGEQDVTITITKVNGFTDLDMTDNTSQTVNVISRAEFVQRKVLLEMFSTEKCVQCPQGHQIVNGVIEDNDNVVEVCHHAGYYTDSFTIDASSEYEWFYNGSTYAPALMLDRTNMYDKYPAYYGYPVNYFYENTPVFWQSSASFISLLLDKQLSEPAYATVNIETEQDGGNVTVNVSGEKLLPVGNEECRLFVILTEDNLVTHDQVGSASAFYYQNSPRMMLSDTWGDAIDLDEGYNKTYNFTVSDEWDTDQLKIVAFVSTYNADDCNGCRVLNTETFSFAPPVTDNINGGLSEPGIKITGNTIFLPADCNGIEVFNASGTRISSFLPADGQYTLDSNYPAGVYIVRLTTANGTKTAKMCVK